MTVRDEIVWRSGLIYFVIVLMAIVLVVRIIILQYVQRGKWEAMSEKYLSRLLKCLPDGEIYCL